MERKTKPAKKPDLILTSDWHLREDQPKCRTDNFWEAQWKKVRFIRELQERYGCPVVHAGDMFHHWKPSPYLITMTLKHLPENFYSVYGQHDLPQHNLDLAYKAGLSTLDTARHQELLLSGVHFGKEPRKQDSYVANLLLPENKGRPILIWHRLVWAGYESPWPGCTDPHAQQVLKQYPEYDLIVTGDNHKPFVEHLNGKLLVNPGALTRQEADEADRIPVVYLYYAKENEVGALRIPHEKGVVSREHIERKQQKDKRIEAFVSRLDTDFDTDSVSFEGNLDRFEKQNDIKSRVMEIVRGAIEDD